MVLCFSCYLQWFSHELISLPYFLGSSGAIEAILPNRLHIFKPLSHPVKLILLPYFRWCLLKVNCLRLPVYCTGNVNLSGFSEGFFSVHSICLSLACSCLASSKGPKLHISSYQWLFPPYILSDHFWVPDRYNVLC